MARKNKLVRPHLKRILAFAALTWFHRFGLLHPQVQAKYNHDRSIAYLWLLYKAPHQGVPFEKPKHPQDKSTGTEI